MKVHLIIESCYMECEPVVTSVIATKEEKNGSVTYEYTDDSGKTSIEILKNSAIISREGFATSTLILKEGVATTFEYKFEHDFETVVMEFNLFTRELKIEKGKMETVYATYQKGMLVNEVTLSLTEK